MFSTADVWGFNQCKRTEAAMDMVPDCFANTHCENGGTAVYETNVCWCECPEDWQGDSDCSKPTMPYKNLPEGSDICKYDLSESGSSFHSMLTLKLSTC